MDRVQFVSEVVDEKLTASIMHMLYWDLQHRGLKPGEAEEWRKVACPFPHLRFRPEVLEVGEIVLNAAEQLGMKAGKQCEPQFIWHWPQDKSWGLPPPHLDQSPPWASDKEYSIIAGLALTSWGRRNGSLRYWLKETGESEWHIQLNPGDVVIMQPDVWHASGINRSDQIRAGIYFRWLQPEAKSLT